MRCLPCLLLLASCSEPAPADARQQRFDVGCAAETCSGNVELVAGQPVRGENHFLVTLTPAEAELETASGLMVAHGHGSTGSVLPGEPSEVSIELFMAGRWDLTFELSLGEVRDRLEFTIDVP